MSLSRYFQFKKIASGDQRRHEHDVTNDTEDVPATIESDSPTTIIRAQRIIKSATTGSPPTEGLSPAENAAIEIDFDASLEETKPPKQIDSPLTANRFAVWTCSSKGIESIDTNQSKTSPSNEEATVKCQKFKDSLIIKKRPRTQPSAKVTSSIGSPCKKGFIPMKDLSVEEQQSEIVKWHTLTTLFTHPDIVDTSYTIEDRRYHMLLTTLLHTRCQEPNVRVAIIQLVNHFQLQDIPITVQSIVSACHTHSNEGKVNNICSDDLVPLIKNLQYYNTKAKYIMQSSQYINEHFHGIVPTTKKELLHLPGIGPLFADLLFTINTIPLHERHLQITKRKVVYPDNYY